MSSVTLFEPGPNLKFMYEDSKQSASLGKARQAKPVTHTEALQDATGPSGNSKLLPVEVAKFQN